MDVDVFGLLRSKLIILQLTGGLGNQMFQYAAAKSLALQTNSSLYLDDNYYRAHRGSNITERRYGLGNFPIGEKKLPLPVSQFIRYINDDHRLRFIKNILCNNGLVSYVNENNYSKHKSTRIIYMQGYWQSAKYFATHSSIIRDIYKLQGTSLENSGAEYPRLGKDSNAVMVHVRRSDYVSNKSVQELLYVQDINYYRNAISTIQTKIPNPQYYVFSDDIDWCKRELIKLLPANRTKFVSNNNTQNPINDLRLMSQCDNFIISNSTFSWWAAWLSKSKEKVIIAPKNWFKDIQANNVIVPKSWIRL